MVKTTKKLLNFLQSLNKYVQKKTEKEYLFIRRYILFWENENRKGAVKPRPLCTPLGLCFKGVLGCGDGRLLTCGCILRCWDVGGCADRVVRGRRGVLLLLGLRVDKFFYFLLAIAGKLHV